MKAIYLDCFAGISGNMLLGAFLQAGVPLEYLERELAKLFSEKEYELRAEKVDRCGIQAVHVNVLLWGHQHAHMEHSHHEHRSMAEIREMLLASKLSDKVKERSLLIFEALAEAEGKIHGKSKAEVCFHEVGAVDSIVDIVGTAICLDFLRIERIFVSRLNTGTGFVDCAHGRLPVPAPATAELLRGIPFYHDGTEKELVTPTGAAVVKVLAEYAECMPKGFTEDVVSYGAGTWELSMPNVLRMYVGEYEETAGKKTGKKLFLMETNIDDMNPQIYGFLMERLFEAGALDVWTENIYMKKNRPAQKLSVLVDEEERDACEEIVFRETTSIGIRVSPVWERVEAKRKIITIHTRFGTVRGKLSTYHGRVVSITPEYEDCRLLAKKTGISLKYIQQEAEMQAWQLP